MLSTADGSCVRAGKREMEPGNLLELSLRSTHSDKTQVTKKKVLSEKELLLTSCKFRRVLRLKLPLDELPTTLRVKAAEEVSSNGIIIWEPAAKTIKSSPEPPQIPPCSFSHKIPQNVKNYGHIWHVLPVFTKLLSLFTLKPRSLYQC